ncbi:MAG: 5-formyltetrahydrofolate cyclo-ligase [Pseudomonadota bacterium]
MTTSDTRAKTLRNQLRTRRKQLTPEQQTLHALQAVTYLQDFLETLPNQATANQLSHPLNIALFLSQDGELNTQSAIEYLWHCTEHRIFLPALETKPELHMAFVEYQETSLMINNQFGIPEPQASLDQHLSGQQMDIVLMPLVGFDLQGNRMGMGGGYYDRTFEFKRLSQDSANSTLLIGWAHSCQQVSQLPNEAWDVPLDGIITEQGYKSFKAQ